MIKSFQPPDDVPVVSEDGRGHIRWLRYWSDLNNNANSDLGEEAVDTINAHILPALSRLRGFMTEIQVFLFGRPVVETAADVQLQEIDAGAIVDASGAARTITLPDAAKVKTRKYFVKKDDSSANSVFVDCLLSQTINGESDLEICFEGSSAVIQSNGSNYFVT